LAEERPRAHQRDLLIEPRLARGGRGDRPARASHLDRSALMIRNIGTVARWLHRRAENIAALMLATMFACFIVQIFFRYVLNHPVGWTEEVSTLMWIWGVLWGAVFVLRESDEVRFDIIYSAVSERTRRVFTIISSLALVVFYAIALPGVVGYVLFMKVERSAYLGIRFDYLYSIYILFAVAAAVRYAGLAWRAWRGHTPQTELAARSTL
jgi:C4-dicarboxylate transporter, DctQ subunit